MRFQRILLCSLVVAGASGCSVFTPPQAWEKGALAKPEMSMGGDALQSSEFITLGARDGDLVYTSKENASGGYGVGGGGCGCN